MFTLRNAARGKIEMSNKYKEREVRGIDLRHKANLPKAMNFMNKSKQPEIDGIDGINHAGRDFSNDHKFVVVLRDIEGVCRVSN
jgi:hypothetical protein